MNSIAIPVLWHLANSILPPKQLCAPAPTLQKTCWMTLYNKMILFLLANVAMHIPIGSSQHDYFPCHLPLGNIYGLPLFLFSHFHVARCFFPSHPNIFLHIPVWLQLFFSHLFVAYLKSFLGFPLQLSFQFLFSIENTIFYSPVQNSHKEQQLRKVKEYPGTCEKDPCTQLWVMTLNSHVLTLNHFVYSKTVCTAPPTLRMNSIPI